MGLQLIFAVETNKKCKSDWIYIKETIDKFYEYSQSQVKLSVVYMDGKGKYQNKSVKREIEKLIKQYAATSKTNESKVIYCFDCDDYDRNQEDATFICEDIKISRELLKELLAAIFDEMNEEAEILAYDSGEALLADAKEGYIQADLLFLDIYMKQLNGMDVARIFREHYCRIPIIFMTGTSEYAVESYEVQAAGYLLKPYDKEKLRKVIQRVLKIDADRRLVIKTKRQYPYPYLDEILYLENYKHNVIIHLENGSEIVTTEKMGELEKKINDARFLRCHQSFLVNMDYIKDAEEDFVLKNSTLIPIRVRGRKEMVDKYHDYFENKQIILGEK